MISLLLWFVAWLENNVGFTPFVLTIISSMLLMWLNHLFALLHSFSRMMASSFILLNTAVILCPFLEGQQLHATWIQFCLITFLFLFISCYQYRKAQGVILYAFATIGIISLTCKPILYFVPLLWLLIGYCMVTFSMKIMLSSIFGIALPYMFVYCYILLQGTGVEDCELFNNWYFCTPFNFKGIRPAVIVSYVTVSVLSLFGYYHLILNGHKDRVRTRLMFQIFAIISAYSLVMALLQPLYIMSMLSIETVATSAIIGHYITTTRSNISNYCTIAILCLTLFVSIYHLF
ncbi:MAG: hypothetical protein HUK08_06375 [Bacteroidaceae bacterium]|nr:hypothetical protein [Bacteroidaceae bacterium]